MAQFQITRDLHFELENLTLTLQWSGDLPPPLPHPQLGHAVYKLNFIRSCTAFYRQWRTKIFVPFADSDFTNFHDQKCFWQSADAVGWALANYTKMRTMEWIRPECSPQKKARKLMCAFQRTATCYYERLSVKKKQIVNFATRVENSISFIFWQIALDVTKIFV